MDLDLDSSAPDSTPDSPDSAPCTCSGPPDSTPDSVAGPPDTWAGARRRALGLPDPGPGYLEVKIRLVGGPGGGAEPPEEGCGDPDTDSGAPDSTPDGPGEGIPGQEGVCEACGGLLRG